MTPPPPPNGPVMATSLPHQALTCCWVYILPCSFPTQDIVNFLQTIYTLYDPPPPPQNGPVMATSLPHQALTCRWVHILPCSCPTQDIVNFLQTRILLIGNLQWKMRGGCAFKNLNSFSILFEHCTMHCIHVFNIARQKIHWSTEGFAP